MDRQSQPHGSALHHRPPRGKSYAVDTAARPPRRQQPHRQHLHPPLHPPHAPCLQPVGMVHGQSPQSRVVRLHRRRHRHRGCFFPFPRQQRPPSVCPGMCRCHRHLHRRNPQHGSHRPRRRHGPGHLPLHHILRLDSHRSLPRVCHLLRQTPLPAVAALTPHP